MVKKPGGSVTLTFAGAADCETYVYFKNLEMTKSKTDDCTMTVSGNGVGKKTNLYREGSLYTFQRDGVTFNLGYSADGVKQCKVTFDAKGTYTFDALQVVCLPMADYVRDVTALGEVTMEDSQGGSRFRVRLGDLDGYPDAHPVHPLAEGMDGTGGRSEG